MSADKCPCCNANLCQYGWEVVCENECGFQCDVADLQIIIDRWNKTHKLIIMGCDKK